MKFWNIVSRQFGKPSGMLGRVAGYIMGRRPSNIERNDWGIFLLQVQPSDVVLEIGFGPGLSIQKISKLLNGGVVYGVDHSLLMFETATKRNREAILSGKVKLQLFSISECPQFEQRLDKILDVNSFQFWPDPVATLTRLRGFMNHSGTIVLVHQPRKPGATDNDAMNAGQNFCMQLEKAGFTNLRIEMKMMKPVSTIAAVGTNPD